MTNIQDAIRSMEEEVFMASAIPADMLRPNSGTYETAKEYELSFLYARCGRDIVKELDRYGWFNMMSEECARYIKTGFILASIKDYPQCGLLGWFPILHDNTLYVPWFRRRYYRDLRMMRIVIPGHLLETVDPMLFEIFKGEAF